MEQEIGGSYRWGGKTENAHLKGQQRNAPEIPTIEVKNQMMKATARGINM